MDKEENLSAIVTFSIDEVTKDKTKAIELFTEMDDNLGMSIEFKDAAANALFERIVANKEIHLLAIEAEFIKNKAPKLILSINYYEQDTMPST